MTVKALIELNQMITDVEITVRKDGSRLLDQINIGVSQGIKPPFPTMVPKDERYIDNMSLETKREAYYIEKSINAWDDGKDYWQIKVNKIPSKWLELEVYSWDVWRASTTGCPRRERCRTHFNGQRINIIALPSGNSLKVKEPKIAEDESDGQMTLNEWLGEQEF